MRPQDNDRTLPVQREPEIEAANRPVLITGGAGFIGCNLAHRLLREGRRVIVFDNLSRNGVTRNLRWLREQHGEAVEAVIADVRDPEAVQRAVARAGQVFHFAAQVAVTTSLDDPVNDFSVNGRGTINVLEAIRRSRHRPPLVFTSTNKVYGGLDDVALADTGARYTPTDATLAAEGVGESRPLDFHSPYGCSKGTADQYVRDYARSFGLQTVVFRMSCIYGPHQFGTEDQGWVAHFLIRALDGEPIVLYGDGKQVRDILFVEDLVNALVLAQRNVRRISGQAFNIGGGAANTTSLIELLELIGDIHGAKPDIVLRGWRTGDQRYYVSNTARFRSATGWSPAVGVRDGVRRLYQWLIESRAPEAVRAAPKRRTPVLLQPITDASSATLRQEGAA
jgi:CDP-paratose 2-epimerase